MKLHMISIYTGLAMAILCLLLSGCGGGTPANVVIVTVNPSGGAALLNQQVTFFAVVTGASDTSVTWKCTFTTPTTTGTTTTTSSPAPCPDTYLPTASITKTSALFVAPSTFPNPPQTITLLATSNGDKTKSGKAIITIDSGVRITIKPTTATLAAGTPQESLQFTATVSDNTAVTWLLTQATTISPTAASCETACGTIDQTTGVYTAPATLPTNISVSVVVSSVTDPTRFAVATVTLVDSSKNTVVFSGISPAVAPLGGIAQYVYLNVTNLRTSVPVTYTIPGAATPTDVTSQITIIPSTTGSCPTPATGATPCPSSTVARLTLNAAQLSFPGTANISITNTGATTPTTFDLTIAPERPALVGASPDSFSQGTSPTFRADGGYYGSGSFPDVKILFNGQLTPPVSASPRQISLQLNAFSISNPGLYPVSVVSNYATPSRATTNIAIQPSFSQFIPPPVVPFITLSGPNPTPSAIAVDSNGGYAVVTEQAIGKVQIVSLSTGVPMPGAQLSVGLEPTGVAIDTQLVPPTSAATDRLAVVVNSGDQSLSFLGVPSGAYTVNALSLTGLIPTGSGKPYAVGVDSFSHRALVAYSSSNVGFIVQLEPIATPALLANCLPGSAPPAGTAYCAVSSVSLTAGATPQIAFQPDLHLAYVSPGGKGLFSLVDLTKQSSQIQISPAPGGAVCANNFATINTVTANGINPITAGSVLITGLPLGKNMTNFNGAFQVIPGTVTPHTFTYSLTCPGGDTGGSDNTSTGFVGFASPAVTFALSSTVVGVAVNPETSAVAFADPNAAVAQVGFISALDQSVTSTTLTVGSFGTTPGTAPELGATYIGFQPFTNVAVSFNPSRNEISLLDPVQPNRIAPAISTGQTAIGSYTSGTTTVTVNGAMAVDPKTNFVLVANAGSQTLSYLDMGNTDQPVQIGQVLVPNTPAQPYGIPGELLPQATRTTASTPPPPPIAANSLQILGKGFQSGAVQVRLDGMPLPAANVSVPSDSQILFSIPPSPTAPYLSQPRQFALDVVAGTTTSNVTGFTVAGTVDLISQCATGASPQPAGVAIDEQRQIAVVTVPGCSLTVTSGTTTTTTDAVVLIDVNPNNATYGQILPNGVIPVGKNPQGVAVIPRLGLAVMANNSDATASILHLDPSATAPFYKVEAPLTVGTAPNGVAIDQDTGMALIANTGSNTVSAIDLSVLDPLNINGGTQVALKVNPVAVDTQPLAIAIDVNRKIAVVTAVQLTGGLLPSGVLDVLNLTSATPTKSSTQTISGLSLTPTGIAFDPAGPQTPFYVTSTQSNVIYAFNPDTSQTLQIRVGIDPTSVAYNFQSSTILTVNTASNTISVVDSQTFKTKATLAIGSQSQFAAAIDPLTNLAVIADQANSRVILFPLPN